MPDMISQEQQNTSLKSPRAPAANAVKPAKKNEVPAPAPVSYFQLLEEDRFCEVLGADLDKDDHRLQFARSLRLEEDAATREMTGANSPYYYDPAGQTYTTPIARFFQALQLSLQITPAHVKLPDYNKARELLLQLESEEPGNAAYPLHRLRVEQALGAEFEELFPIAEKIRAAVEYNSHGMDVWRLVRERMSANATKYLVGISYISTLPVPDYVDAIRIVKDLDAYVPGVREKLGNLMVREGLEAKTASNQGGFMAIEYSIGRSLVPWVDLPNYLELDRKLSGSATPTDFSMTFSAFTDDDGHQRKCDESTKIDFYAAIREIN